MTIQIKAIEQYFRVVLFIMLHKVVLTFDEDLDQRQCSPTVLFVFQDGVVLFPGCNRSRRHVPILQGSR